MKFTLRHAGPPAGALIAALFLGACADEEPPTSAVFRAPPWAAPETYQYRVTDRGVDGEGRCTLSTTPNAEPGRTLLERRCTKDEFGDSGEALVQSETLTPVRSERLLTDSKKQKSVDHTVAYDTGVATFTTHDGDDLRETTRDLPEPSEGGSPDWYDDESIIWMVRGIELRAGYRAAYHHIINAGQPRILVVELAVSGPDRVKVPAGEFTAWRVRVQRSDSSYFFWVTQDAPHTVVQAKIEEVTYSLLSEK
ncbi:MAG: DUF3108 domain-containing protein [Dehalococcoidia bacterium]